MDKRFKPIGGMFQGVRGSTVKGGSGKFSGKLVRLNDGGLVDDSCLPPGVSEATNLSRRLDQEIADRREGDSNAETVIEAIDDRLTDEVNRQASELAENTREVASLASGLSETAEQVAGLSTQVSGLAEEARKGISDLNDAVSGLSGEVGRLSSRMDGIDGSNGRMAEAESAITGLQTTVSAVQLGLTSLTDTIASLTSKFSTYSDNLLALSTALKDLQDVVTSLQAETATKFEEQQTDINTLKVQVEALYNRLFPGA